MPYKSGLVIWFVVPVPSGVDPNAWHLLAIFVATIAAIILKVEQLLEFSDLAHRYRHLHLPWHRQDRPPLDSKPEDVTEARNGTYLALVNYHANPITSAMFVTATAQPVDRVARGGCDRRRGRPDVGDLGHRDAGV